MYPGRPALLALFAVLPLWLHAEEARCAEGAPRLGALRFEGNQALSSDELTRRAKLKPGAELREERVAESVRRVRSAYEDLGFMQVSIATAAAAREGRLADLRLRLVEGTQFRLGRMNVAGNRDVPENVIRRELGVAPGMLFDYGRILEGNRRLYASGCFDFVDMRVSSSSARRLDLDVKVKERDARFFKGATGYGSETKERVTVGLEDLNFFGGARRLDVKSTFSGFLTQPAKYQTTRLEGDLIQPYLFGTRWDARANLSEEWRKREAYDSDATTLRTSLDRRLNSLLWLSLRYRFSGTRLKRASAEAQTAGFTNVSAAGPSLRYDTTDDPFLPRNGWRLIGSFEEGLEFGPGDVGFHKYEGRAGRFDTVGGWTFFEGAQGGLIQPRSGKSDDIIPIYERYFLGGANSVRGYPERQLGPKDVDGKPLGGTSFMVGNFEIRRRIYKALFSVVFLDAGQLFTSAPANPDSRARLKGIDDLAYGAGGGLRLHSPIGAIRLELGYQLRPQGGTKFRDRTAVHFSVGEVF